MANTVARGVIILVALALVFSTLIPSGSSAAVTVRRSVRQNGANGTPEECRTNAVCGWQIYNVSSRAHVRYVATTCRCKSKDQCTRAEEDVGVPAYVYRCTDKATRRSRTTTSPSVESSGMES